MGLMSHRGVDHSTERVSPHRSGADRLDLVEKSRGLAIDRCTMRHPDYGGPRRAASAEHAGDRLHPGERLLEALADANGMVLHLRRRRL